LEKKKLIQRDKGADDKRESIISLTVRGEKFAQHIERVRADFTDQFLDVLTKKEREQLGAILEKLYDGHAQGGEMHFSVRGHHWWHSSQRGNQQHD
jgi:DNA-binding MarR family transcriptional regulator